MPEPMTVENWAQLPDAAFGPLRGELAALTTMERVLHWLRTRHPSAVPEELVAQDEFSYDLLVPLDKGLYLSYDTS